MSNHQQLDCRGSEVGEVRSACALGVSFTMPDVKEEKGLILFPLVVPTIPKRETDMQDLAEDLI